MLMKSSAKHGAILFFDYVRSFALAFLFSFAQLRIFFFHFVMFRLFSFAVSVYSSLNFYDRRCFIELYK